MSHSLDIPAFLIIPAAERAAAWKGIRFTKQGSGFRPVPSRQEEAATRRLRRQIEKAEAQADAAKREARRERAQELRDRRALRQGAKR